jgi:hypothetical protein
VKIRGPTVTALPTNSEKDAVVDDEHVGADVPRPGRFTSIMTLFMGHAKFAPVRLIVVVLSRKARDGEYEVTIGVGNTLNIWEAVVPADVVTEIG